MYSYDIQVMYNNRIFCSDEPTRRVEPIRPPADSVPGDKIVVEGYENGTADNVLNPKKKIWEKLQVWLSQNNINIRNKISIIF